MTTLIQFKRRKDHRWVSGTIVGAYGDRFAVLGLDGRLRTILKKNVRPAEQAEVQPKMEHSNFDAENPFNDH